ncbi:Uncharacterised protein [Mycobacteroides abscessus subsp. abscessus]|nr:Uncharacterised protein [Mycobacteroides abscessus subsp. abscessus]
MRALIIQPKALSNTTSSTMPPPPLTRGANSMMTIVLGTTSSRSTSHMIARSVQPPSRPATDPAIAAIAVLKIATQKPMISDFCAPRRVWASTSCPIGSVPNG